ncbi:hypothetical protein Mal4_03630 [Maioricimonas rarisocia]|uniref:WalW protein n=1 Tax=Maioricimonas rarisocia TaxID=2528026 RepID=A0A517Z0S7_9PLAN|nr:polysaccharide deacetylase family protein [Maioricimonas rarisocia]QDU36080.1 hypothetical protein Mal4_03630 [Maioricimonas rarisocia]
MKPVLIVTVDTEEEGLWGGRYRATENTVENIQSVPLFQEVCDRYGIQPTYLVDTPVIEDERAAGVLQEIHESGRAEIGAHLHPWCCPPLDGQAIEPRRTYMCNLPEAEQRDKLRWLTDAIEERFGRRPTSFRAGRYGLDITGARLLQELGYVVDSSVIPFTDYSPQGGPDFRTALYEPYRIGNDDLRIPADDGALLEVPVSVGFNCHRFARTQRLQERLRRGILKKLRLEGILDRLGLVRRIKFSPEQSDAGRLIQLADAYVRNRAPVMVLMFHSSSLLPGMSPYVSNRNDLDRFLGTLDRIFEYCCVRCTWTSQTLTGFAEKVLPAAAA